ncbi:MAG: hypothetical protein AAFX90_09700 [Pseudomonadota bacterium]
MRTVAVSFFAAISLLLTACTDEAFQSASSSSVAGKTQQEKQLEKQVKSLDQVSKDIIVNNTVQGALAGAVVGCGLGLLLGGDAGDCAAGAAAGGLIGGVGGNQVGRQAAAKNVEIVNSKQVLANLSNVSKQLSSVEANLRSVLASQNAELKSLRRQLDGGQLSQSAYNQRVNAIKSNRQVVSNELKRSEQNMDNTISELKTASSKGQPGLGGATNAAVSNKDRLARTRASINLL